MPLIMFMYCWRYWYVILLSHQINVEFSLEDKT